MNKQKFLIKIRIAEEKLAFATPKQAARLTEKIVRMKTSPWFNRKEN